MPEQANKRPNEMSGGQQQRVTVARSLVNDPAIVWADEPTGALDSETSAEIVDLLVKLNREQGQTFVLVTHDASVARRAHRIVRMRDGLIEGDEPNGRERLKMDELFGIPTKQLTLVLLGVFAVGALILAFLAVRDRTSFRMAVRNIPPPQDADHPHRGGPDAGDRALLGGVHHR